MFYKQVCCDCDSILADIVSEQEQLIILKMAYFRKRKIHFTDAIVTVCVHYVMLVT